MNTIRNFLIHSSLFLLIFFFTETKWPDVLLLIAQVIFVPVMFLSIVGANSRFKKAYPIAFGISFLALGCLMIFPSKLDDMFAFIYLLFTIYLAAYGIKRFIHRGFTHIEEFLIDCGFIFLAVGGMWFFASVAGLNTGFSNILNWLTAIHFHYSASLFLIFFGLLGRSYKPKLYPWMATLALLLPWVMALGITFSAWIEIVGACFYLVLVYYVIFYCLKTPLTSRIQKVLISTAFSAVGLTIIFAFLYVLSNGFGILNITIPWMLLFHGVLNAFLFGFLGVIGFIIQIPKKVYQQPNFPISQIQRKYKVDKTAPHLKGLVDQMGIYLPWEERAKLGPSIIDFYENTVDYRLFAVVRWKSWFKPFAVIYKAFSKLTEQINLPISKKKLEMTGDIYRISDVLDGRRDVRSWVRQGKNETIFTALYSFHESDERTYMNIALPLPFTSIHGILALERSDASLILTSKPSDRLKKDAGIYLISGKKIRFRLPLAETFYVEEIADGKLTATHKMQIMGLPFLSIDYKIMKKAEY